MEYGTILLIIALIAGFYMAWSIGANDVANAMGTSVGSGALTIKKALIVAAILEFAGAFFVGTHVSETIRQGIISPDLFAGNEIDLVFGMIGALLAAAVWLQIATYFGWPVSTTHSIVGAVLGFGVMHGGIYAADWTVVGSIAASWIISPVMCGIISYVIFSFIRRTIILNSDPVRVAKKITPFIVFFVFLTLTLAMVFKGLKNLNLNLDFTEASLFGCLVGLIAFVISYFLLKRIKEVQGDLEKLDFKQPAELGKRLQKALRQLKKASNASEGQVHNELTTIMGDLETIENYISRKINITRDDSEYKSVERIFVYLQIMSAGFVAFAHGANDVANAVGPLATIVTILQTRTFSASSPVPLWMLALGGIGIIIGLATWGWRVMVTIGRKITELTPSRGFAAEFATALTVVLASKLGLPISTTHTLVGGVLGVGFARGINALNLKVITNILISWIITIPIGALGAVIFYYILRAIFS